MFTESFVSKQAVLDYPVTDNADSLDNTRANKQFFKDVMSSLYQFQKLRVATGNRICAHFYKKMGIDPSTSLALQAKLEGFAAAEQLKIDQQKAKKNGITLEEQISARKEKEAAKAAKMAEEERKDIEKASKAGMTLTAYLQEKSKKKAAKKAVKESGLSKADVDGVEDIVATDEDGVDSAAAGLIIALKEEYKRISDILVQQNYNSARGFVKLSPDELAIFSDYSEYVLMEQYMQLLDSEEKIEKQLGKDLLKYPIYTEFLQGVKGCGTKMSAVIVACFDPYDTPGQPAKTPSSFWKYAGVDVAPDGRGRRNYKEHLIKRTYTNKAGVEDVRDSVTYNPFVKTKLLGVLSGCMLKAGNEKYVADYRNYKQRLENHPAHITKTPGHRNRMALRYMIKRFLVDLYLNMRRIEGLPITEEYSVRKLGMVHHAYTPG